MKFLYRKNNVAIIIVLLCSLFIFWQFFLKNLYPFPGNYLLAWFEPWKSGFFSNGSILIAHKPVGEDVLKLFYPFKMLAMDIVKKGEWPLWNPYNGAGMPLLAVMHMGFFTPFNILFLIFPGFLAFTIYLILQTSLLSISTYIYARKINLSIRASIFSSLAFLFSGVVIARITFGEFNFVLAGLPLLLFTIESLIKNPKSKIIYLLPIIIFVVFTSGHPQIIFYVLFLSIFYVLYKFITLRHKTNRISLKKFSYILLMFIIGTGLSAIQLMPTLELMLFSSINPQTSQFIFNKFLLDPSHLITILIPNYFGNQAIYNYWGQTDYIETIASVGLIPVFFAFMSSGKINNKLRSLRNFYFVILVLTIILTLDWFGTRWFYSLSIPIISTGIPSRIFCITSFAIAILAGFGYDKWCSQQHLSKTIIYRILFYLLIIIAINVITLYLIKSNAFCQAKNIIDCYKVAFRNSIFETSIFLIFLILLITYNFIRNIRIKYLLSLSVIFIILSIGLYNSNKYLPFSSKETFYPKNNLIFALQEKTKDTRVFTLGDANIKNDLAMQIRFNDPDYFDPLHIKRYAELISYANTQNLSSISRSDIEIVNDATVSASLQSRRDRLLDIIGVRYLLFKKSQVPPTANSKIIWQDPIWYIVERENNPSRIYIVSQVESYNKREDILKRLFDRSFDPRNTVILEENHTANNYNLLTQNKSTIKNINYQENNIHLQTNIFSNSFLVLSDNYYPGWKAFIDSKETKTYRANYTFRAIEIPKGNHTVDFIYQPESLELGIYITTISALFLLLVFIFRKKVLNFIT